MKMNKKLKTLAAAAVIAAFMAPALGGTTASAAAKPAASINNVTAQGEVLIVKGTTYVTLTDLKPLGDYKLSYDNAKKQVTIQGDGKTVKMTAGSKSLDINGAKQTLPQAPLLHRGKTMVPLRAVSQAFDAQIHWNGAIKTAYINKAEAGLAEKLQSSQLATARNAAAQLPYTSDLTKPELVPEPMEMQGVNYYFPAKESNRYFMVDNDIASYFEIQKGTKRLIWQGRLDYSGSAKTPTGLFFLSAIKNEIGKRPDAAGWTVAEFKFRYPVGTTYYRLLDRKGELASGNVELDSSAPDYEGVIVEIPEE